MSKGKRLLMLKIKESRWLALQATDFSHYLSNIDLFLGHWQIPVVLVGKINLNLVLGGSLTCIDSI